MGSHNHSRLGYFADCPDCIEKKFELEVIERICKAYDKKYGEYPTSPLEGKSLYDFARRQLLCLEDNEDECGIQWSKDIGLDVEMDKPEYSGPPISSGMVEKFHSQVHVDLGNSLSRLRPYCEGQQS